MSDDAGTREGLRDELAALHEGAATLEARLAERTREMVPASGTPSPPPPSDASPQSPKDMGR